MQFQPTKIDYTNSATIDWLRFSLPVSCISAVWQKLHFSVKWDDWQESRIYGKKVAQRVCDGVLIACDSIPIGRADPETGEIDLAIMGDRFIVDFSGSGLGAWFRLHGDSPLDLIRYFQEVCPDDYRINRLDLAFDDHAGYLNLRKVAKTVLYTDRFISRWKRAEMINQYNLRVATRHLLGDAGATLYIGDRKSTSFCRIYDKRVQELERGATGEDLPPHWVRLELEYKAERAKAVANKLIDHPNPAKQACQILRGQMDFKSAKGEARIRDREPVRWWKRFTGSCGKTLIRVPREVSTLKRKTEWLENSVSPTLALVTMSKDELQDPEQIAWLDQLIDYGERRLTANQLSLLQQHSS